MIVSLADLRQAVVAQTLRRCRLFSATPPAVVREIAAITAVKHLGRGDYLFHQGMPVHGFFVVQQGAVKLHRLSGAGREQVIQVFRAAESLAEDALFCESGYPVSACAVEPSQILAISKAGFIALLKRQPDLIQGLFQSLSRQCDYLIGLLDDLTLKDANTRLVHWLVGHCPDPDSAEPQTIKLSETKRLLASELGVTSETFSRTLAQFRHSRLLAVNGRSVTVLCPLRLAQWLRTGAGTGISFSRRRRRHGAMPPRSRNGLKGHGALKRQAGMAA